MHGYQHTAPGGEGFVDESVMCLKPGSPHGPRHPGPVQIRRGSLKRPDERPVGYDRTNPGNVQSVACGPERPLQ